MTFQNATKPTEGGVNNENTVIAKTNVYTTLRTTQTQTTTQTTASDTSPRLTLLSAILQALGAYNPTPSSLSVLST